MIQQKATYRSTTLREAPSRDTLAEAEADEARGVEVEAYLALLPTLTDEQWDSARGVARAEARAAAWEVARAAAWDEARAAERVAARAAIALVVRDKISAEHFDALTAPMRAAGIDFNNLTGENDE